MPQHFGKQVLLQQRHAHAEVDVEIKSDHARHALNLLASSNEVLTEAAA